MKIGIYIKDIIFKIGGTESYAASLIYALQNIYPTAIIGIISEKYETDYQFDKVTIINKLNQKFGTNIKNGNILFFLEYYSGDGIIQRTKYYLKLRSISSQFDIFFNVSMNLYTFMAKKNIAIIHFPIIRKTNSPDIKKYPFLFFGGLLTDKSFIKKYNLYLHNSYYTKKWFNKIWFSDEHREAVLYAPIRLIPFQNIEKRNIIMICSRIEASKEIEILIQAYISNDFLQENAVLYILGSTIAEDNAYINKIRNMVKSYPSQIRLIENPDRTTIEKKYNESKIFWHAKGFSHIEEIDPSALEHLGMTTIEAMSGGCVPIVINKGGQKEIVEHGKTGFLWDTIDLLIEKTIYLLNNPDILINMSNVTRQSAQGYSFGSFVSNLRKILDVAVKE
ncbi:MAG: glycosyltransferase [Bacteroidales bacterium]|jgi:glycosyltransferase involved in cell wall biosynthesis|nr:glycosyltransferase [Bacteroidales bacterium]